ASLASSLKGRAAAVSGDTLRIARTTVRLSGIEAPIPGQTCTDARNRPWACGAAAEKGLSRVLGRSQISCEVEGEDADGVQLATCRNGEQDIAEELVRRGYAFAQSGFFFSTYGSAEDEAQAAKAGIWAGEAARPADYRDKKWAEASEAAPDGCPIKGNVDHGKRVYLLPWSRGYERAKVIKSLGERWFCSEAEAREAGFAAS
ncbi:MAG TPA: thermonuclease family protein, partial [Planctomycetes bacterium]|nr:thermonuclease family protein [Planctomycetota bacterium]